MSKALHAVTVTGALFAALAPAAVASRSAQPTSTDLVELDVVVTDRDDHPVAGLRREDFEVKDDGRTVDVKTFAEQPAGAPDEDRGRRLVLLLDDSSVPMAGTPVVRAMAQAIVAQMRPRDEVSVVRLNNDRDEPYGDVATALQRIDGYHAAAVPYQDIGTAQRVLGVVASISRALEGDEHMRKILVCIGFQLVCNPVEPHPPGYGALWPAWVKAVAAAARANVGIYAAIPSRPGVVRMINGGLVEATGGDAFANTSRYEAFVSEVWRDASAYYLLGYWPGPKTRDLHDVEVKIARKGARVRVRRLRG